MWLTSSLTFVCQRRISCMNDTYLTFVCKKRDTMWTLMWLNYVTRQVKRKLKQVELYNQHAKDLPVLKPNDVVRVRKDDRWANKAQVLVQISPRSYKVLTKEGKVIRRNRRQLWRTRESMNSSDLRDTCNIDVEHSMSTSLIAVRTLSTSVIKLVSQIMRALVNGIRDTT